MPSKELPKYLITERVLKDQWYIDQLTLLLRKSYGIKEQIKLYMDIVRLFNDQELKLFGLLGTYDEKTGLWLLNLEDLDPTGKSSDLLDKMGAIFGVQRYYEEINGTEEDDDGTKNEALNNTLMWCLIYANIIRNNYDGTYKMANQMYKRLKEISNGVIEITLAPDSTNPMTALFYLNTANLNSGNNVSTGWSTKQIEYLKKLFDQGYFDIKSSGIKYNKQQIAFNKRGFFDHVWENSSTPGEVDAVPADWDTNPPKWEDGKTNEEQSSPANYQCTWDHAYWS